MSNIAIPIKRKTASPYRLDNYTVRSDAVKSVSDTNTEVVAEQQTYIQTFTDAEAKQLLQPREAKMGMEVMDVSALGLSIS